MEKEIEKRILKLERQHDETVYLIQLKENIESKVDQAIDKWNMSVKTINDKFDIFRRWMIGTVMLTFVVCILGQSVVFFLIQDKINKVENKVIILENSPQFSARDTVTTKNIP